MKNLTLKIVSGGQTGVDLGALNAAKKAGIATGGCLPKGCKTEDGIDLSLKIRYTMYESTKSDYKDRTEQNVRKTDATVILTGVKSRGSDLTKKICEKFEKEYVLVDINDLDASEKIVNFVQEIFNKKSRKIILNLAGNRESKYPGIENKTMEILEKCFSK